MSSKGFITAKERNCSNCSFCENKGENKFDCHYLRQRRCFFISDATDTAEECKWYVSLDGGLEWQKKRRFVHGVNIKSLVKEQRKHVVIFKK